MSLIKVNNRGQSVNHGRRNLLYNGAMQVSQRKATTHTTTGLANAGGIFTVDRFSHRRGGSWSNAQFSHTRVAASGTGDVGLIHALQVKCTTAEGAAQSNQEGVGIGYYMEKGDTHRLGVGTSGAVQSVLSFYAKSSIATTYGVEIQAYQHSTAQAIRLPFTINSANTWQRVSVVIPGDTVALDSDADNTSGWLFHIILDGEAGPSNTHNQWGPLDTTTAGSLRLPNGVNTTGFSNTLNATFDITGVQLEEGTIPTPFEHRTYAEDLRDCQRYYFHTYRYGIDIGSTGSDNGAALSRQGSAVTNHHDFQVIYAVPMRTTPNITFYSLNGTVDRVSFLNTGFSHQTNVSITGTYEMGERGINGISVSSGNNALGGQVIANAEL